MFVQKIGHPLGQGELRAQEEHPHPLQEVEVERLAGGLLRQELLGDRVPPVAHQEDLFVEDDLVGHIVRGVQGGVHDDEVHLVVGDQAVHLAGAHLEEVQPDLGVFLGESGQDVGQEDAGPPVAEAHAEGLGAVGADGVEVHEQLLVELAAAVQIAGVYLPGGGQGQGGPLPVQQPDPKALLQTDDVLAQVGLGDIQLLCRLGDAPLGGDREEIFRIFVDLDHRRSLLLPL